MRHLVNACGTALYAAFAVLKWMQPVSKQYCFFVLQLLALSHMSHTMCIHLCIFVKMGLPIHETNDYLTGLPDQPMKSHRATLYFHRTTTTGQICVISSCEEQPNTSSLRIAAVVFTKHWACWSTMQAPGCSSLPFRSSSLTSATCNAPARHLCCVLLCYVS